MKRYIVTLTEAERKELKEIGSKGKHRLQEILNVLILLGVDEGEFQRNRSTNKELAQVLEVSMRKIDRVKKTFVNEGLEVTLKGKKGSRVYKKRRMGILRHIY